MIAKTSLNSFFSTCREAVDRALDELIPTSDSEPHVLHQAIRWSVFAGGKRLRPTLVLAVGQTFDVEIVKLVRTAAAFEMIHAYSLVHDDLPSMDNDELRRGRPTCHVKFDEATAILAGDALQTLAFQTIAEDQELSFEIRAKLIAEIARAAGTPFGMVAGQVFDLNGEKRLVSSAELEKIHHHKTGALISAAARAGAIVGNADEQELNCISTYAAQLGLLFQITDDLLDVTATIEDLGKTPGKDAQAEKATYPKLYGMEQANKLARNTHQSCLDALAKISRQTILLKETADFILYRQA